MVGLEIYIALVVTVACVLIFRDSQDWRIKRLRRKNAALQKEITDLLSGETLPPGVQEKVDAIFEKVNANTKKLSKSVTDNTPE